MKYWKKVELNKKGGGTPIVIGILVVVYFILLGLGWYNFSIKQNNININLVSPESLSAVYAKESQINLLFKSLLESSAKNIIDKDNFKSEFVQNSKAQIGEYKKTFPQYSIYLDQLYSQLNEDNILIEDKMFSIKTNIKIEEKVKNLNFQLLSIEYNYQKEFIFALPQ